MRKNKLILVLIIAFVGCNHTPQTKNNTVAPDNTILTNANEVSVAFYNMENLFDYIDDPNNPGDDEFTLEGRYHYTKEIYEKKLHNLATVLQAFGNDKMPDGPALIGCAEIENDKVLQDLTSQPEIKLRNYKFVHFDSPDARGIDVALIYNPKYFKILSARPLHVNLKGTGGKETTRDVLYVKGILSTDTVYVFVNHWPSRMGGEEKSDPKRAIAAGVDRHSIDSLLAINPASEIIVMGDMNDDPTNPSITDVLKAKGNRDDVKETDIYNPWATIYENGNGTLTYKNKWDLFDQIMFSGEWLNMKNSHLHYSNCEIFNRDFLTDKYGKHTGYPHRSFKGTYWINGYSDHFPVIAYLTKGNKN